MPSLEPDRTIPIQHRHAARIRKELGIDDDAANRALSLLVSLNQDLWAIISLAEEENPSVNESTPEQQTPFPDSAAPKKKKKTPSDNHRLRDVREVAFSLMSSLNALSDAAKERLETEYLNVTRHYPGAVNSLSVTQLIDTLSALRETTKLAKAPASRPKNEVMLSYVAQIAYIYYEATGKRPTRVTRKGDEHNRGPFENVVRACLDALDPDSPWPDNAIGKVVKLFRAMGESQDDEKAIAAERELAKMSTWPWVMRDSIT